MAGVMLSAYEPRWVAQFAAVSAELAAVFGPGVFIEHIGSTAVPGLCAKPVLDVLLGAGHLDAITAQVAALAAQGFVYRPVYEAELPQRRYFVREPGELPRVHLHGVVHGEALWRDYLRFRDRLRAPTRRCVIATPRSSGNSRSRTVTTKRPTPSPRRPSSARCSTSPTLPEPSGAGRAPPHQQQVVRGHRHALDEAQTVLARDR